VKNPKWEMENGKWEMENWKWKMGIRKFLKELLLFFIPVIREKKTNNYCKLKRKKEKSKKNIFKLQLVNSNFFKFLKIHLLI
jgi:hypothetical protein